jgi:hypothetical protein
MGDEPDSPNLARLLRKRAKRPGSQPTAHKHNKIAPSHGFRSRGNQESDCIAPQSQDATA